MNQTYQPIIGYINGNQEADSYMTGTIRELTWQPWSLSFPVHVAPSLGRLWNTPSQMGWLGDGLAAFLLPHWACSISSPVALCAVVPGLAGEWFYLRTKLSPESFQPQSIRLRNNKCQHSSMVAGDQSIQP